MENESSSIIIIAMPISDWKMNKNNVGENQYLKEFFARVSDIDVLLIVTTQIDKHTKEAFAIESVASRFSLLGNVNRHFPVGAEFSNASPRKNGGLVANAVQNFTTIQIDQHSL